MSEQAGHNQHSSAARSASHHQPMNPQPQQNVLRNYLARMLPKGRYMQMVYRLGEKVPPGFEDGWSPIWEVATALLPAQQTTQLRINFQREFHLFAIAGSSSLAGGFRAQLYDMKKQYYTWANVRKRIAGHLQGKPGTRLAGRGVNFANYFGQTGQPLFLREPHPFSEPDAQALVIIQNQDTSASTNQIQIALFGMARRFNWPD